MTMLTTLLGAALTPALAADGHLPQRDTLLDPATLAYHLHAVVAERGATIERCRIRRVKYRIGESLRVVAEIGLSRRSTGGRPVDSSFIVSLRTFPSRDLPTPDVDATDVDATDVDATDVDATDVDATDVDATDVDATDDGPLRPVTVLGELSTIVWAFPRDRRLTNLGALMNPSDERRRGATNRWYHSELVEYGPERGATVRMLDGDRRTVGYAKASRGRDVAELAALYNAIAAGLDATEPNVGCPRALNSWTDIGILALQPMSGCKWSTMPTRQQVDAVSLLGRAIAAVHGLACPPIKRFVRLELPRVSHSAEFIGQARPDLADRCAVLAHALRAPMPDAGADVLLHGDVHPGNAMIDGDRINLIDFDQAGRGPAVADIASLIARLRSGVSFGEFSADHAQLLIASFLGGYDELAELPAPTVIRRYVAAALIAERGLRAVNRVRHDHLADLANLLDDTFNLLNGASHETF